MAQVGDAGAAQLRQRGEGRAVRRAAEHAVDEVTGAFERCAMVRRAQEDEVPQPLRPAHRLLLCLVQRAAHHQPAHAVREHADRLQRHRPVAEQPLQLQGQLAAVVRDMLAAVVAHADDFGVQRRRQHIGMAAPGRGRLPLQLVHAQAVHQQQHTRRQRARQRFEMQRAAVQAQAHRRRQRVVVGGEPVADDAVQRRQQRGPARRLVEPRRGIGCGHQVRQHALGAAAHQPRHAAHAAVHGSGQAARAPGQRAAGKADRGPHRAVHALGNVRHAQRGIGGQPHDAAQVGGQRARGGGGPGSGCHHLRISVLLPNRLSIRSTASSAVRLRTSSAGFSSITSSEASRPQSAIISMHSCASR